MDARLVAPGTRYEILDGRLQSVPPADPQRATLHAQFCALLGARAAPDYTVACDMLTRTSQTSDIAPDASVYPVLEAALLERETLADARGDNAG